MSDSNAPPPPSPLTPAQINEYLDYADVAMRARRAAIIAALEATAEGVTAIEDDETLGEVAENMKMGSALIGTVKERFTEWKKPFLDGGRVVDAWQKRFVEPLTEAMTPVQQMMNAYGARKLAEERTKREAARVLAEAEANRLAEVAAKEMEAGRAAREALDRASDAATAAAKATAAAQQKPAAMTRSRGVYGTTSSAREIWKWRLVNINEVPRQYLMVSEDAIKEAARARDATGKPTAVIGGIEWYSETVMR